jgi:succinate dehydrogenase flavin-adding protein (antitoxin of CptAB toxin-antitoxin module)
MQSFLTKLKDNLKKKDRTQLQEILKASDEDVYSQIYYSEPKSFNSDKTHELFFGSQENQGKKTTQQINELLLPRLIGFRTPSQDLETLK